MNTMPTWWPTVCPTSPPLCSPQHTIFPPYCPPANVAPAAGGQAQAQTDTLPVWKCIISIPCVAQQGQASPQAPAQAAPQAPAQGAQAQIPTLPIAQCLSLPLMCLQATGAAAQAQPQAQAQGFPTFPPVCPPTIFPPLCPPANAAAAGDQAQAQTNTLPVWKCIISFPCVAQQGQGQAAPQATFPTLPGHCFSVPPHCPTVAPMCPPPANAASPALQSQGFTYLPPFCAPAPANAGADAGAQAQIPTLPVVQCLSLPGTCLQADASGQAQPFTLIPPFCAQAPAAAAPAPGAGSQAQTNTLPVWQCIVSIPCVAQQGQGQAITHIPPFCAQAPAAAAPAAADQAQTNTLPVWKCIVSIPCVAQQGQGNAQTLPYTLFPPMCQHNVSVPPHCPTVPPMCPHHLSAPPHCPTPPAAGASSQAQAQFPTIPVPLCVVTAIAGCGGFTNVPPFC